MSPRRFRITWVVATIVVSMTQAAAGVDDVPSILVSRQLLESQRLSVGDVVSVSSDPAGANLRRFRIAGGYEPMPDPMRLGASRHEIRMHLPDLIDLTADTDGSADGRDALAAETVDAINVALAPGADPVSFARTVSARLPGIFVRSTGGDDQRTEPFRVLERFHLAIAIVTVLASSIFLLALMLMLVDEKRETVGTLRLIGFRRRRILLLVFVEGVVIAAAGALFGIALSAAFQDVINRFFQWRYDTTLVFVRITPRVVLRSIGMAVPLGVVAVVAASWTLLRRQAISLTRR